jgi:hypothetical protein
MSFNAIIYGITVIASSRPPVLRALLLVLRALLLGFSYASSVA